MMFHKPNRRVKYKAGTEKTNQDDHPFTFTLIQPNVNPHSLIDHYTSFLVFLTSNLSPIHFLDFSKKLSLVDESLS